MNITIERIANNLACIRPLMEQYKRAIGEEALTDAQYLRFEQAVNAGAIDFFVARDGAEAVGMCSVSKTFSTFACEYSGVFEDFFICEAYRQKGVARQMTAAVFAWCRQNGISSLWVGSADCDAAMYQHLGFELPLGNLLAWTAD